MFAGNLKDMDTDADAHDFEDESPHPVQEESLKVIRDSHEKGLGLRKRKLKMVDAVSGWHSSLLHQPGEPAVIVVF